MERISEKLIYAKPEKPKKIFLSPKAKKLKKCKKKERKMGIIIELLLLVGVFACYVYVKSKYEK